MVDRNVLIVYDGPLTPDQLRLKIIKALGDVLLGFMLSMPMNSYIVSF